MTLGQGINLGPFSFTVIRILLAAGIVRVIVRGERIAGALNKMDWLMFAFGVWALISSAFHKEPSAALIFRLGFVYNTCGVYFLLRVFCQSIDDVIGLYRMMAILLIPLATEMLFEKVTIHNLFSVFGGVAENPAIRKGMIRAQGPFAHSILAGTVGAVCLPFMIGLWKQNPRTADAGIVACITIVFASASSGPIMSAVVAIGALFMWYYRHNIRQIKWFAILGYLALDIVMKAPAYYLITRIDLTGSSTGWHRARLIEMAFKYLNEWWFAGTDYTRHWMPTGVSWSTDNIDITNHYIKMGVLGGLPLMLLFIAILIKGFSFIGQVLQQAADDLPTKYQVILWTLGASLFANVATMISVSYFDQSFIFLYITLAAISSAWSSIILTQTEEET